MTNPQKYDAHFSPIRGQRKDESDLPRNPRIFVDFSRAMAHDRVLHNVNPPMLPPLHLHALQTPVLFDGAMGTLLHERGLQPGECPELWCAERPDDLREIHRLYKEAGADVLETNSFGANRHKLAHYGLENRLEELNRAAARLARETAGEDCHVLGSMGPTGAFLEPYGDELPEAFTDTFSRQARALWEGGADAVIVETMTVLEECCLAVRAAREAAPGLTVVASFTFDPQPGGGYASMMGVRPGDFAAAALEAGAHIVASNCGLGPDHMLNVIPLLRAALPPEVPVLAMPNAGMPVIRGGQTVFTETPADMAAKIPLLLAAGARCVGGCCGTTPAHIRAFAQTMEKS